MRNLTNYSSLLSQQNKLKATTEGKKDEDSSIDHLIVKCSTTASLIICMTKLRQQPIKMQDRTNLRHALDLMISLISNPSGYAGKSKVHCRKVRLRKWDARELKIPYRGNHEETDQDAIVWENEDQRASHWVRSPCPSFSETLGLNFRSLLLIRCSDLEEGGGVGDLTLNQPISSNQAGFGFAAFDLLTLQWTHWFCGYGILWQNWKILSYAKSINLAIPPLSELWQLLSSQWVCVWGTWTLVKENFLIFLLS